MEKYNNKFSTCKAVVEYTNKRKPDFENIKKILNKNCPDRFTLFEFFLHSRLFEELTQETKPQGKDTNQFWINGFKTAGYDYATLGGPIDFYFPRKEQSHKNTISQNDGAIITDEKSFEEYKWPNPNNHDFSFFAPNKLMLPDGMKVIVFPPGGIFENTVSIVGYDNLCYMLLENPELVKQITDKVGSTIYEFYSNCLEYQTIGAYIFNDDWGFNNQTMISPVDLRKYIIPWYKKIADMIHKKGKYVILHSCGNLKEVMDDVILDIKCDAKHSFEDKIIPVEDYYKKYSDSIAILGGIDLDFMTRRSPKEIYNRSISLLEKTQKKGAYALGTGNSVPGYIPFENVYSMLCSVLANQ